MSNVSRHQVRVDEAKSLGDPANRAARLLHVDMPHVAPLTSFVRELRREMGPNYVIPFLDPHDGGTLAKILFLLEAPGPRAVKSGFISRNNPDETAKNFYQLNQDAGIDRQRTVIWNIVPWYIGSEGRIRPARRDDIAQGLNSLNRFLRLLPCLEIAVLVGKNATYAKDSILARLPAIRILSMPHPSPTFVNRAPANRQRVLAALREVAAGVRE